MNAAVGSHHHAPARRIVTLEDLAPIWFAGAAMAAFTVAFYFIADGVVMGLYRHFFHDEWSSMRWPVEVVVGIGVFAVVISLVMGRWLFNLRRWIGREDPVYSDTVRRKRRSFVSGSMLNYVIFTPFIWAIVVAYANNAN